jgi:hypothetical protein
MKFAREACSFSKMWRTARQLDSEARRCRMGSPVIFGCSRLLKVSSLFTVSPSIPRRSREASAFGDGDHYSAVTACAGRIVAGIAAVMRCRCADA